MYPFRNKTPQRRANRKVCKHYTSYRNTLKEDFNSRCGYCHDSDRYRINSFAIDHFVPRNPSGFKATILDNDYSNLVYSCRYCNTAKSNKWPTNDETIYNDGTIGFIDPAEQDYTDLFQRSSFGCIEPTDSENPLAHYIIAELKLWLPIHEKMWKLEKLDRISEEIEQKIKETRDDDSIKLLEDIHYKLLKGLQEITKGIFVENE